MAEPSGPRCSEKRRHASADDITPSPAITGLQIEPKGATLRIVTAAELIRRARRYARSNGLEYRFEPARGKGSHGRLWIAKESF